MSKLFFLPGTALTVLCANHFSALADGNLTLQQQTLHTSVPAPINGVTPPYSAETAILNKGNAGLVQAKITGVGAVVKQGSNEATLAEGSNINITGATNNHLPYTSGVGAAEGTIGIEAGKLNVAKGSSLTSDGWLSAGTTEGSTAELNIRDGGFAQSSIVQAAQEDGSKGTINVSGQGSALKGGDLFSGNKGKGVINILDGGVASGETVTAGNWAQGEGIINVSGQGSRLLSNTETSIGLDGKGALNLTDGGSLEAGSLTLGVSKGSEGIVNVSKDSFLTINGDLTVGKDGKAEFNVDNRGSTTSNPLMVKGAFTIGKGSVASFDADAGSYKGNGSLCSDYTGRCVLKVRNGGGVGTPSIDGAGLLQSNNGVIGGGLKLNGVSFSGNGAAIVQGGLELGSDKATGTDSSLLAHINANNTINHTDVAGKTVFDSAGNKVQVSFDHGAVLGTKHNLLTSGEGIQLSDGKPLLAVTQNRYIGAEASIQDEGGTAQSIIVSLNRNSVSYGAGGFTRNGRETGHALDKVGEKTLLGQDAPYLDEGSRDKSGAMSSQAHAQRQGAYNTLSGEINASVRTALFEDSYYIRQAVISHLASQKEAGFWTQAYGGMGHNNANGNATALHHNTAGLVAGYDGIIGDDVRLGGMVGYDHTGFSAGRGRDSSGSSNNVTLGAYVEKNWNELFLRGGIAYTWNVVSTSRHVNYTTYSSRGTVDGARAFHQGTGWLGGTGQAYGEVAYRFENKDYGSVEPLIDAAYVSQYNGSSTENGGAAALHIHGKDANLGLLTAGARAKTQFQLFGVTWTPHASAAYRHTFGRIVPTITQNFAQAGGGTMSIAGAPLSKETALVDTGIEARITDRMGLNVSYLGQYGNHSSESGGMASLHSVF